ncbi:outer membrane beta-barrel protein [Dyadobacter soli]|nr:outer membrane beta-barrel protein [Dyadobacter soli]
MKSLITAAIMALLSLRGHAQAGAREFPRWHINLEGLTQTTGVFAESYRLPGIRTQFSGGKGLQTGVEYVYSGKKCGQLFQHTALAAYGTRHETGWGAMTALGYRFLLGRAYVEAQAGVGYLQTTFRQDRELQDDQGNFSREKFRASGLAPVAALGAGYQINTKWKVYLRYYHHAQLGTEATPGDVRLHRNLNLGVSLKLK